MAWSYILSFNPHFTRMRSEIKWDNLRLHRDSQFQSSFYEDALWNSRISIWRSYHHASFNPHFTRMRSEISMRWSLRLFLEWFQSSFYEDALWNGIRGRAWDLREKVSILILRGCALKYNRWSCRYSITQEFQSSFYEDALWNPAALSAIETMRDRFQSSFYEDALWNVPEELLQTILIWAFQSSFYEDALWNIRLARGGRRLFFVSILILRGCALKLRLERKVNIGGYRFNPHFTRMRSEIALAGSSPGRHLSVSILILRGCALKWSEWPSHPAWSRSFNPHFTRMRSEIPERWDCLPTQ